MPACIPALLYRVLSTHPFPEGRAGSIRHTTAPRRYNATRRSVRAEKQFPTRTREPEIFWIMSVGRRQRSQFLERAGTVARKHFSRRHTANAVALTILFAIPANVGTKLHRENALLCILRRLFSATRSNPRRYFKTGQSPRDLSRIELSAAICIINAGNDVPIQFLIHRP